jgi:L-ribulose-5-phosphate 3-epimerase UlaE
MSEMTEEFPPPTNEFIVPITYGPVDFKELCLKLAVQLRKTNELLIDDYPKTFNDNLKLIAEAKIYLDNYKEQK